MEARKLEDVLEDLFPRFKREYNKITGFNLDSYKMPMANKEHWWCICGNRNEIADKTCKKCGIKLIDIKRILNKKYLSELPEEREVELKTEYDRDEEYTNDMVDVESSSNIVPVEVKKKGHCSNCGKKIARNASFCPHCGKPYSEEKKDVFCVRCGGIIENGLKFCPNCGEKARGSKMEMSSILDRIKSFFTIKKTIIGVAGLVLIIGLIYGGSKLISALSTSTEDYLAEADYENAYSKAADEEKDEVIIENIIANLCENGAKDMFNPSSFMITRAYVEKKGKKRIVLVISGANKMGGTTNAYWLYNYSKDKGKYELFSSESDLDNEEDDSWDDEKDKIENLLHNIARRQIREIMEIDENEVNPESMDRINDLFSEKKLRGIKIIDEAKNFYPTDTSSDNDTT